MSTWIFDQKVEPDDVKTEDGGQAKVLEFNNEESTLFLRVQSWAEDKRHPDFDQLVGKRVRITVETY